MKIRVPITYVRIEDGQAEMELFTATEAQALLGVSHYTWDRWRHDGWIPGHTVDRTEMLFDRYQLDMAALTDGPIREFLRSRDELIEEVIRA